MCRTPEPPPQKEPKKTMFLRNRYLDEEANDVTSLRTGRNSLRIDLGPAPIGGRQPGQSLVRPNPVTPRPTPVRPTMVDDIPSGARGGINSFR